jgi:DNA-binding LacI/PurR family transcriptional regulator
MNRDTARPRRSTIEDVAAAAAVSVATVSRALRGLPNVAASTRLHIETVAKQLGYSPDPAASRLAAGRTRTITAVIPHLSSWYFSNVVSGVEAICAEAGYDLLVLGVGSLNDLTRLLSEEYHLERRTDGLVLVDVAMTADEVASISARGVAIATVGTTTPGHPSVRIDNEEVGRLAADHLIELGHRRIAMISGTRGDAMRFEVPKLRHEGFVRMLRRRGCDIDPSMIESGNFLIDGGREAMHLLLDRPEPPTAVFAMSDEMSFGALMALNERGLAPGRDISLIGVDDHEFSRVVALTTIGQSVTDHGAMAARMLLNSMDGRPGEHVDGDGVDRVDHDSEDVAHVVAAIELIKRSTTAPR